MRPLLVAALLTMIGCGDDAPVDLDASLTCASDADCDDTLFCNGEERCDPSDPLANRLGCVAGTPCLELCDERMELCTDSCADADGDGFMDIACGGSDCDDSDADRSPGATEICNTVDEDCDDSTVGALDADDDGFVSAECCNGDSCGRDCDDSNAGTQPDQAESCDSIDNDCDGTVDEGVLVESWPDADGDRFGDASATPEMVCDRPSGAASRGGDCDDTDPLVGPEADDVCNDADDDCDGSIDEGADELCDASLGVDTVGRCVSDPEGGPSQCYGIDCVGGGTVCGGSRNVCDQDVCTSRSDCGVCGNSCDFSCAEGRCATSNPIEAISGRVVDALTGLSIAGATIEARAACVSPPTQLTSASDGTYGEFIELRDSYQITAAGYLRSIRPLERDPDGGEVEMLLSEADLASILADPDVDATWDRELGIVLASNGAMALDIGVLAPHGARIHVDDAGDASPYTGQTGGIVLILNVLPGRWLASVQESPSCGSQCDTAVVVVGGATSFVGFAETVCSLIFCA